MPKKYAYTAKPYDTPAQRRRIYVFLIRHIDRGAQFHICNYLSVLGIMRVAANFVMDCLPELAAQRPVKLAPPYISWGDESKKGMQCRRRALLRAIAQVDKSRARAAAEKAKLNAEKLREKTFAKKLITRRKKV